jgi:hypothetical protein
VYFGYTNNGQQRDVAHGGSNLVTVGPNQFTSGVPGQPVRFNPGQKVAAFHASSDHTTTDGQTVRWDLDGNSISLNHAEPYKCPSSISMTFRARVNPCQVNPSAARDQIRTNVMLLLSELTGGAQIIPSVVASITLSASCNKRRQATTADMEAIVAFSDPASPSAIDSSTTALSSYDLVYTIQQAAENDPSISSRVIAGTSGQLTSPTAVIEPQANAKGAAIVPNPPGPNGSQPPTATNNDDDDDQALTGLNAPIAGMPTWAWILIGALIVAIVVGGIIAFIVVKRRSRSHYLGATGRFEHF